jgi:flagellar motor switch protein FliG
MDGFTTDACRLRVGGDTVLNLKPGATRDGDLVFAIEARDDPSASAFLETGGASGIESGIIELRHGLGDLSAQLGRLSGQFETGLRGLREAQENLADQLVYGNSERPAAPPTVLPTDDSPPFAALGTMNAVLVSQFLSVEMPQLTALVLFYLDANQAAAVLEGLPEAIQSEVVRRLVRLDRVSPEVIGRVEKTLALKLTAIGEASLVSPNDTIKQVVGMLNLVPAATEKHIIETLERADPELCEQIKARMFVFDDIVLLKPADLSLALEGVEPNDLALAMKSAGAPARAAVLAQLDAKRREMMRQAMEQTGRVRLSDADAAGLRIVSHIRRLEEEGKIVIGRPD